MTGEELIALLNAEMNRIKRSENNKNIGLKITITGGKDIILKQDSTGKWFKNPELMDGCLKIAENNESKLSTETILDPTTSNYIARTTRPFEINYIPIESIINLQYFYDTIEETELSLTTPDDDNNA